MLAKPLRRKACRWRLKSPASLPSWLSTCAIVALTTLLLVQPGRCALSNLTNLLTPSATFTNVSSIASTVNTIQCSDGTTSVTSCEWRSLVGGGSDILEIDLGGAVNVGSIVFSMSENSGDLSEVGSFYLSVEGNACNDGLPVQNNGVVNCLVPNAQIISLTSITSTTVRFSEIYVFEQPDFAQRYLSSISVASAGTVTSGALTNTIGLGSSLTGLNVQVEYIAGSATALKYIQIILTRTLPASIVFVTQTIASSQLSTVYQGEAGGTAQYDCGGNFPLLDYEPSDRLCDQYVSDSWIVADNSGVSATSTTYQIDTIAIMPTTACSVSFEAFFNTNSATITYPVGTGALLFTVDVSATYEPSWCNFVSSGTYYFITDLSTLALNDGVDVQLAFSAGQLSVDSVETSLIDTSVIYYMTTDVNGDLNDMYEPLSITISFVSSCTTTSLDPVTAPSDQMTTKNVPLVVTIQMPWDSVSSAQSDFTYCGPKTFTTTDTINSVSPAAYVTSFVENGQAIDLTLDTGDDFYVGRQTIQVSFSLTNFAGITIVTSTFDVVFCPTSVDVASFQITNDLSPAPTYNGISRVYSPPVNQVSPYTFDTSENCFEYISYRVHNVQANIQNGAYIYDDAAGTLVSSFSGSAYAGGVSTNQLYVTFGDPNDATTHREFLLEEVVVTTVDHPCESSTLQTQATIYGQQTLSESVPYTISAPNQAAQGEGDPTYCGPRTTTYVVKGTTDTKFYASIIEATGEDFTFDIQAPLASDIVGTIEFTISVFLTDYTSVVATYEFNLEFLCPVPNLIIVNSVASTLAFTQAFYQTAPQVYPVILYDKISEDTSCLGYSGEVRDSSNAVVPYISYSIVGDYITVDAYDVSLVNLVGQTVTYEYVGVDSSGFTLTLETFTVTITGPSNPLCYFTVISPASFVLYYRYGDGQVTFGVITDPENDISVSQNDLFYCGGLALSTSDISGNPVSEIVATDNPDATWQFTYDGSSLAESTIGTVLNFNVEFTLTDFTNVTPLVADLTIDVYCPEDETLLAPAEITIVQEMPQIKVVYDVTTQVSLQADLAIFSVDTPCQNVTALYIRNAHTNAEVVGQITLLESTNQISIYTEDLDGALAGTTVSYLQLIDLTDGQTGVQLAFFEVEYVGLNYLPYFDPPLTAFIQIYKQEMEQEWEYVLPSYFDSNPNDSVSLSVSIVNVEAFMSFSGQSKAFQIENLADPSVPSGTFSLTVTLSDGIEVREFPVSIVIYDVGQIAGVQDDSQVDGDDQDQTADEVSESTDELVAENENLDAASEIQSFVFDWRAAFLKKEEEIRSSGNIFNFKPPKPRMSYIRETGEVVITFDQQMQLLPSLKMIKEGKIEVNGVTYQVFEMKVIPAEGQDPLKVQFDWVISEMTQKSIRLKLQFKSAVYVSAQMEPDILEVIFRDRYLFVSINDLAISDKPLIPASRILLAAEDEDKVEDDFIFLRRELPMQLQLGGIEEQIQEAISAASSTSQIAFASNFLLNLLLAASLQQLWSMVNTQQLIVMMPLFQIKMPGNAAIFFGHIMSIAAFDFIEFGDIIHEAFSIEATDPINDQFNSVGFESQYFLNNLGTIALFYIVYLLFVLVVTPLLVCCGRYSISIMKKSKRLNQKIYWNSFLTLLNETFMILIVSVLLNMQIFSVESPGLTVMSILCAFMLLVAVIAPVIIICRLCKFFDKLKEKEWKLRYSAFYADLNLKEGRKVLSVPGFFLFRRVMLGLAICVVGRIFIWQIFLMIGQIITQIMIIGSGVYEAPGRRRTEFFNEIMLMFVIYIIFCFTPWIDDVIVRFQLGYLTCFIVGCHLVVNFFLIFRASAYLLGVKCKRRATVNRFKAERKLRRAYLKDNLKMRKKLRAFNRKAWVQEQKAKSNAKRNMFAVPVDEADMAATKSNKAKPKTGLSTPKTIKKVQFQFQDATPLDKDLSTKTASGQKLKFAHNSFKIQKKNHHQETITSNYSQIEKDASQFLTKPRYPWNEREDQTTTQEFETIPKPQTETRYNQIVDKTPIQTKPQEIPRTRPAKKLTFAEFIQGKEQRSQETTSCAREPAKKLTFAQFLESQQQRTQETLVSGPVEEEKVANDAPPKVSYLSFMASLQAQQSGVPSFNRDHGSHLCQGTATEDLDLFGHSNANQPQIVIQSKELNKKPCYGKY